MLRPFLTGVGMALGALGTVAVAAIGLPTPSFLTISNVTIDGTDRARPVEVRHLADVHRDTPIWAVSPETVAAAVERHPWVRSAEVAVRWPARVEIEVQERQIAAVLLDRERWVYIDDRGVAFLHAEDVDYPVLTNMGRELDRIHPDLGGLARRRAIDILHVLQREEVLSSEQISEIAFAPNVGFVVHTQGATLLFGLDGVERQVRRLDRIVAKGVDLDQRLTVDLAPADVALVRPTMGRYPTVANDFRSPGRSTTLAMTGRVAR